MIKPNMLTLKNIRKTFGTRRILDKVSFSLGEGQKAALIGQNGVGKSTLLKIIAGLEPNEKGDLLIPNRALIGYLPQEVSPNGAQMRDGRAGALGDETLFQYLRRMAGLNELEAEMQHLEARLDEGEVLARYEIVTDEYRRLGGYDFEHRVRHILDGLLLSRISFDQPLMKLSGGEKRKVALAGVLLRGVDILLLDEPTNNLDLPALLWLERYIERSTATFLIASHDRRFLDHTVQKVIEIDWFKRNATMYTGGWSAYAEMRAHQLRQQKELYRMQEEERVRLLSSMDEKRVWAEETKKSIAPDRDKLAANFKKERAIKKFHASARALENREKKLHTVDKPLERELLVVPLPVTDVEAEKSITLRAVRFGYSGGYSGGPIDLVIPFGARVAFLGSNGAGKSTLLKTITGTLPLLGGALVCGQALSFGYLMQEHENVSPDETPVKLFDRELDMRDRDMIQRHLSQFQFSPDVIDEKIKYFSPGERVRLILALLSAKGANALVLDEPTNHLDLEAIEALEEALEGYPGTILLVTHDRLFLEKMRLTQSYVLENGHLAPCESYEAYAASLQPSVKRILKRLEERVA